MQSNPSQMATKTKEADRSSPATETGNSMAPTLEPSPSDARVPPSANARKRMSTTTRLPPPMQSNPSQMTPKTKGADRSSPVTETDNSMAPTPEPSSADARVPPSANARKRMSTTTRLPPPMQSNPSQMTPKTKGADRSSPVTETDNSMAPTPEPSSADARVPPPTNARKLPPRMQSKSSQTIPKTKEADKSSPVTDTGNSMARAPTQEPTPSDARVPPSTSDQKESHQHTKPQGEHPGQGNKEGFINLFFPRLRARMSHDREEEHITQETSRETREADFQDGTSPQQMNSNIRSTHPGSHRQTRPGQIHDERSAANVREDVDDGVANKWEAGGNELSENQSLRPSQPGRRESARGANFRPEGTRRRENDNPSSQQMNRNIRSTHSTNNRLRQTHDERGGASVREDVHDEGANGGEGRERGREVKEAERNELSTNQSLHPSNLVRNSVANDRGGKEEREVKEAEDSELSTNQGLRPVRRGHRREPTRDAIMHSGRRDDSGSYARHGQIHDERVDVNVREGVDDEGANEGEEGEREVKEAEDNEPSTNQGLRPSHPGRKPYHRWETAREAVFRLEGTLRSRERDVNVLSTRNEQMRDEIKTLTDELARLQLEQNQMGQLLHERTVELSSAQFFLGKADTISVSDVSRMVDILNAEILQASNSITDSLFDHQVTPATPDQTELNRLLHKGQSSIGARLCKILARRLCQPSEEFDPMITQLALQAGLSKACYRIINDWNPPFWDSSSTVNRMYTNMRLSVGQVTAGRWRALARTYINGQDSEDGGQDAKERIQEANADYLRSTLRDLLTIIGWSPRDSHQDLPSEYSEKMRFLSNVAVKLHETIGRGITSKDLIVDIIACDTPFDPSKMDNADKQRRKLDAIPDDTVACTVELGLSYKSARPGGDSEETGVILKPKVLLASVLVGEETEETPKPQD